MTTEQAFAIARQHHRAGRFAEAEALYRQVLATEPAHVDAMELLGVMAYQLGQCETAVDLIRRAIVLAPQVADFHSNLGLALAGLRRWDEAIVAYRQAIALQADFALAHHNLGVALESKGDLDEAMASYRRAIACDPGLAEAHGNLGVALCTEGKLKEGVAAIREAIKLAPASAQAWNNLGTALKETGPLEEVIAAYRHSLALQPGLAEARSNLALALHYDPLVDPHTIAGEHAHWERQHGEPLRAFIRPHPNDPDPGRRLRIGYVSADFREHAVAIFVEDLLAHHDNAQVEVFCYSNVARADAVTARLRRLPQHWREIFLRPDAEVADLIREDKIDILVDLAGHTGGNRLTLFARQPAPVQASWLGYPDDTGLRTIDYQITDVLADPPTATDERGRERLLRISPCAWSFRPPDEAPDVGPLPAVGNGLITFGCFSTLLKINEPLIELWGEILRAVPHSRLLLKNRGLCDPDAQERLRGQFEKAGIARERVELAATTSDIAGHLAFYHRLDIGLDTFPYHGTATTCEALWMGVPVIALAGKAHASRVGASLLTNAGLGECIADSPAQYVTLAVALAQDLQQLTHLRQTMRDRLGKSALMDGHRFAQRVEAAYRAIWTGWCASATA